MVQRTYFIKSIEEMQERISEVKSLAEYSKAKSVLALMYVNGLVLAQGEIFVNELKAQIPEAVVSGISVINSSDDWTEVGITLSIILFSDSNVDLYTYKAHDYNENKIIDEFSKVLTETEDVKAVLCYPVDTTNDFSRILEKISEATNNEVTLFGSVAGASQYLADQGLHYNMEIVELGLAITSDKEKMDGYLKMMDENKNDMTYSIGDELINSGCVFVVLSGGKLNVNAKYVLGWNSLGKGMKITGAKDPDEWGNACITELDGIPASEIYKKYLDVDVDEFFLDNVCEFPITIKRGNSLIARVPLYAGFNRELFFAGDIGSDEIVKLSYAVPSDVINTARKAAEEVKDYNPEAVILSVCFNRFHFLKEREREELDFFLNNNKDLLFGFGGSEILKSKGEGGILNSALCVLALREGEHITDNQNVIVKIEEKKAMKPLLERLITFLNTASGELEEAYEEASAANEAKTSFLSNMSHEIRTPINAIIGMNEMILRESGDEQITGYSKDIKNASLNLLRIVNDVLDFSKIEAGKMEILPVEYELASIVHDLLTMVSTRAEEKGLKVELRVDPRIPHILYGDEIRLKQVIMNLLTNAVKYTEKGGIVITFNLKGNPTIKKNDSIIIEVSIEDTGIGIKDEDMGRLFNSFERVDEVRNRTIEGTGLGMAITQELLHLMGSDLLVKSDYGVGSIFSFEVEQKVIDVIPIGNYDEALRRSLTAVEEYQESFVAPNAKLLVVDDTEINLTVFKNLLKKTKVQIDTATSGKEALELIKERKYDIIFLDHRMPEMDGIECLKYIKEDKKGININTPVIALTANAISGSREMYLNAGFDNYLTKPIHAGILEKGLIDYLPENLVTITEKNVEKVSENEIPTWIKNAPFINHKLGINNCGGLQSYMKALDDYKDSVDDIDDYIKKAWKEGRIKDYTTKVHALKSSSRIIGAMEIGNLAEHLEIAGDKNDIDTINELTSELLIYHNAFGKLLERYMNAPEQNRNKPEISKEKLEEAYLVIKEMAEMYDYDVVTGVMESLASYAIPADEQDKYNRLRIAVKNANWDEINRAINM